MSNQLNEQEIEELLRIYHQTGENQSATAEEIERSRATVKRYVEERYEEWKEENVDDEDDGDVAPAQTVDDNDEGGAGAGEQVKSDPSNMSAGPSSTSLTDDNGREFSPKDPTPDEVSYGVPEQEPAEPEPDTSPGIEADTESLQELSEVLTGDDQNPYSEMGYGEFVKEFFQSEDFGTKEQWENAVSKMCEVREELPDERSMERAVKEGSSGIGKNNDFMARVVAETYWDEAQRFLDWKSREEQGRSAENPVGNWRGSERRGGGNEPGFAGGNFESHDRRGGQRRGPDGGHGQPGQKPASWDDSGRRRDPEIDQLREAMKGIQETQKKLIDHMRSDTQTEEKSVTDELQEYVQLQNTIEQLSDDGGDDFDRLNKQMQRQMNDLRRQLKQQEGNIGEGDNEKLMLAKLAAQGDVEDDQLQTLASIVGTTDPEVKRAEYDLKKAELKAENRREMMDSLFSNMENAVSSFASSGIGALMSGGDGESEEPESPYGEDFDPGSELPDQPGDVSMMDDDEFDPPTRARFEQYAEEQAEEPPEDDHGPGPMNDRLEGRGDPQQHYNTDGESVDGGQESMADGGGVGEGEE